MAVLIRAKRVEEKIRRLAREAGETLTDAVEKAVDQRRRSVAGEARANRPREACRSPGLLRALPRMNEHLTDDEVIGYNEWGTFGS